MLKDTRLTLRPTSSICLLVAMEAVTSPIHRLVNNILLTLQLVWYKTWLMSAKKYTLWSLEVDSTQPCVHPRMFKVWTIFFFFFFSADHAWSVATIAWLTSSFQRLRSSAARTHCHVIVVHCLMLSMYCFRGLPRLRHPSTYPSTTVLVIWQPWSLQTIWGRIYFNFLVNSKLT